MNDIQQLLNLYSNSTSFDRLRNFSARFEHIGVIVPFSKYFTPEGCQSIAQIFAERVKEITGKGPEVITYDKSIHTSLPDLNEWIPRHHKQRAGLINPFNSADEMDEFVTARIKKAGFGYFDASILCQNANLLDAQLILRESIAVTKAYELLSDCASREIYKMLVAVRLTGDRDQVRQSTFEQYFHPNINLNDVDQFVDCGASDGNISRLFFERSNGRLSVHAFEPEQANFKKLIIGSSLLPSSSFVAVNKGVWKRSCELRLSGGGISGTISLHNGEAMDAISLDEYFAGRCKARRIIKMDVEGAEFDALLGASDLLRSTKPVLIVCLYHLVDDLWKIILLIYALNPSYSFYIGHHGSVLYETVLYAL